MNEFTKKNHLVLKILLGLLIISLVIFSVLTWRENRVLDTPALTINAPENIIKKGEYIARLGDCTSCHTAENGAFLAGGYSMNTPFGTLVGSNITPSAEFGIGRWTSDDFYKAITEGIAPPSRHLYPAMPYSYFTNITREDSDALYAYLMSIPAIDIPTPKDQLTFPFNQRMLMIGWNMLFLDKQLLPAASQGNSTDWKRGQYIVETLGHCAMCHSPMGDFGEVNKDQMFQGNIMGRFQAPNITPQALADRGWTPDDIAQYLSTGISPQGSAFSDMYTVIHNSSQYMTKADTTAIATYLMGDTPPPPRMITIGSGNEKGRDIYLNMCSACHNLDGSGKPNVAIAMINNSTIRNIDAHNLITAILDGLPWQSFPNDERMQSMPNFDDELTDEEIADLTNYLRTTWGGLPDDITSDDVKKLRK